MALWGVPPEWVVPSSKDSHVTQAMVSACVEGSIDKFEQLYQNSAQDLLPPASYLVRCAVRSRQVPMLQRILKIYRGGGSWAYWVPVWDPLEWSDRDVHLQYAVFLAIIQRDCPMLGCLLKAGASLVPCAEHVHYWYITSLLELAITEDQVEVAHLLIRRGSKPNGCLQRGPSNCTTLAAIRGSKDMLKLMLYYRGKVKDSEVLPAMVWHGHSVENAQYLLDLNLIDVNKIIWHEPTGLNQGTALHTTASVPIRDDEHGANFAAWLLEHGVDYTIKDGNNRTAMELAEETGQIQIKTLIEDWIRDHTKQEFSPRRLRSAKHRQSPLRQLETPKRRRFTKDEDSKDDIVKCEPLREGFTDSDRSFAVSRGVYSTRKHLLATRIHSTSSCSHSYSDGFPVSPRCLVENSCVKRSYSR